MGSRVNCVEILDRWRADLHAYCALDVNMQPVQGKVSILISLPSTNRTKMTTTTTGTRVRRRGCA